MADAIKREMVIEGLEHHHNTECDYCPYYKNGCAHKMFDDAIALLKEYEPRLLTKEDFAGNPRCDKNGNLPVWIEYRSGNCGWTSTSAETMYAGMYAWGRQKYRYWTGKPTKEQMEATPWEE